MLRYLRSKPGRIIFGIAVLFVIPSFVVFYGWNAGQASERGPNATLATVRFGTLDTITIDNQKLDSGRRFLIDRMAQAMFLGGEQPERAVIEAAATNRESFLGTLDHVSISRHGQELGMRVGSDQIVENLAQQIPDRQQRLQQLAFIQQQTGLSFDQYIEQTRAQQTFQVIQEAIKDSTRVTVNEAWLHHRSKEEKLEVGYIQVDSADFRAEVPDPTTATLEQYLEANGDQFRLPTQAIYEYIVVSKDELRGLATITDDEITSAYEARKSEFIAPRAARASMILMPSPATDETTVVEMARNVADQVVDRARKGEDFSALFAQFSRPYALPARETDESTQTEGGGFLGLVAENVLRVEFGDELTSAVFSAAPGSVIGPLSASDGGFYIVKVHDLVQSRIRGIDEVADALRAQLSAEYAERRFVELGELLENQIAQVTTLEQLAAATGTTVTTSGRVNRNSTFLPRVGILGGFQLAVEDLDRNAGLEVFSDDRRHLVIQLVEEFPSMIPDLETVRSRVLNAWRNEQAQNLAERKARQIEAKAKESMDLVAVALSFDTTVTVPQSFKRSEASDVLGFTIDNFEADTVGLKAGEVFFGKYRNLPNAPVSGFVVMGIGRITAPDRKEFLEKLPQITAEIRVRKRLAFLNEFLQNRRVSLTPKVNIRSAELRPDR
jgi:peptidyl-prolyl cis-trans isomerase D